MSPRLPHSTGRIDIADQNADEAAWLAARRGRLTASDLFTWVGEDIPRWWSSSRREILDEKVHGVKRAFGKTPAKEREAHRKMRFGRYLEEVYLQYFSDATGVAHTPVHAFMGQERWPHLGATLDAVAELGEAKFFDETWFSDPDIVANALAAADREGGTGIIECKSTGEWSFKKGWAEKGIPDYYQLQPRLQMAIAEVDWCIVICGAGQDMTAETIVRDDDWADFEGLLDDINQDFADAVADAREERESAAG